MYNELYQIWKREKENKNEIQRLPKEFYGKLASYIKKMKEEYRMLDKKTLKARLMDKEFKNVKAISNELFFLRFKKLQEGVFSQNSISMGNLTQEEKTLFGDVLSLLNGYHVFHKDILHGKLSSVKKSEKQDSVVLRFIEDIPGLIGVDMKTYGPFGPEDIAILPLENARILINQGLAIEVHTN